MVPNEQPRLIGHFELLDRLGSGAMGVVYRARDTRLRREVALKLIRGELTEDHHTRARFLRECQAAAAITHPGIATVFEAGETDEGRLFFAAELIVGESLREKIVRGPLPVDRVIDLGARICEALAAAHARGIVHRDIKPANVMILDDGSIKILDFGLARLLSDGDAESDQDSLETATQTRAGVIVGTPAYMSPEQATGGPVDARTDVFACGSVLYAAASGREAFLTGSVSETLRRIISRDPDALETIDPSLPKGLRDVIRKALAKDPDERFASAAEMAEALRALRQAGDADRGGGRSTVGRRRGRLLAGLAVAAAVVAAGVWLWGPLRGPAALPFESRDKLLIATVENLTQDRAFDLALRTALEADLRQSRFATVFDQGQISETLKLMRKDPSAAIDEELGRDVCRFAGVRALLLPRILSVGDAYELQAILVDPISGRHVDTVRVTARGREAVLLNAIDELSRRVRERLGESLEEIQKADFPVVQVTTSSWEALQYLTLGNQKWQQGKFDDAAAMYELALKKDPHFVAAKGTLGLVKIQFLGQPEEGKRLLSEALAEAEDLPEREYLMVKAVHRQFVDADLPGALEDYALISELYPDMMQPYNNRGRILAALGRNDEAATMFEKAAELDPTDSVPLDNLYWLRLQAMGQPRAAERAARRMVALGPDVPGFHSMLAWSLVAQQRFDEALEELRRVLADDRRHPYALPNMAHVLYTTGRAEEAVPYYRTMLDEIGAGRIGGSRQSAARDLALALIDSGRAEEAAELVRAEIAARPVDAPSTAVPVLVSQAQLLALLDRDDEAARLIERALGSGPLAATTLMELAQAYALLGRDDEALERVEQAYAQGYRDRYFPLIMPAFRPLHADARFMKLFESEG